MPDHGVLQLPAAGGDEWELRYLEHLQELSADHRARMPLVVSVSQTPRSVVVKPTVCICRPAFRWVDGRMLTPLLNRECERHGFGLEICDPITGLWS